jgi:hypothetical protein
MAGRSRNKPNIVLGSSHGKQRLAVHLFAVDER